MKTIFFNQRSLIICSEGEFTGQDPEAVIVIDNRSDSTIAEAVMTFDSNENIPRLYILCDDIEDTYRRTRSLFTEVDAAGGLVRNDSGQYLMILRNGIWDLPKGKREAGEEVSETALREVMEECGIPEPELGDLLCTTDHTYHRNGQFVLKHTYWYRMRVNNDTPTKPQTEEGIIRTAWIPASGINGYAENTYPSIREVLLAAGLL